MVGLDMPPVDDCGIELFSTIITLESQFSLQLLRPKVVKLEVLRMSHSKPSYWVNGADMVLDVIFGFVLFFTISALFSQVSMGTIVVTLVVCLFLEYCLTIFALVIVFSSPPSLLHIIGWSLKVRGYQGCSICG